MNIIEQPPNYLDNFIIVNSYLAYKNFVADELTKLTDKLTNQIDNAEIISQYERKDIIEEIKITQEQIHHIFSHLKYLSSQVLQINSTLLNKISKLIQIIRYNRRNQFSSHLLDVLLDQVDIQLFDLPMIEQTEIALFIHMAFNEKRIIQTSTQLNTLNQRLLKLNKNMVIHIKKRKIN